MTYGLGVDVGTTFTAAAICRAGRSSMVILGQESFLAPSTVFAAADNTLLTGEDAEVRAVADPTRAAREFKRSMGDPTPHVLGGIPYSTPTLLAALIRNAVRTATEAEGGPPARIVLTHPAVWGSYRREHFAEVGLLSGWESAIVVSEPEAAAAHYSAAQATDIGSVVLVYDLGGGTFDTTLLRLGPTSGEVLGVPDGVDRAGGLDFDDVIFHYVDEATGGAPGELDPRDPAEAAALARLRRDCTAAKEALSVETRVDISVLLPGRHTRVELSRAEFEHRIRPILQGTVQAVHRTLRSAGVRPADLAGVILAGGSSRIPLVGEILAAEFGRPILSDRHPKNAVSLGAAAIAARSLVAPPPHTGSAGAADGESTAEPTRAIGAPPAPAPTAVKPGRADRWTSWRMGVTPVAVLLLLVAVLVARGNLAVGDSPLAGPAASTTPISTTSRWPPSSSPGTTSSPTPRTSTPRTSTPRTSTPGTVAPPARPATPAAGEPGQRQNTPTPAVPTLPSQTAPETASPTHASDPRPGPIRNIATGHCLDSNWDGAVYAIGCNPGDYQVWSVEGSSRPNSANEFRLVNRATGRCLDNGSGAVYTLGCNGGNNQTWIQMSMQGGGLTYQNLATGIVLDCSADSVVSTTSSNGSLNQRWVH